MSSISSALAEMTERPDTPASISAGLVKAAAYLRKLDRTESEISVLKAAITHNRSITAVRALFWASQRGSDVDLASGLYDELIQHYNKKATPSNLAELDRLRGSMIATISLLDDVPAKPKKAVQGIPNRLLYLLNYSLPQVSNGYATRGQGMALGMKSCGIDLVCLTRPGFPTDVNDQLTGADFPASNQVEGIDYLHDAGPVYQGTGSMSTYLREAADVVEARLRELRPSVVMAASNYMNALPGLIAARRCGIPFWYEVRGFWEITRLSRNAEFEQTLYYQVQRKLECMVATGADRVFTLTNPMIEELVERGVAPERIALLPNSCDPSRFTPRPRDRELAKALGIPDSVPVIGYVGSFAPYEGLEDLTSACAQLRQAGAKFRLLLVGGEKATDSSKGPVTDEIERIAAEEGLDDWLVMTGRIPHEDVEAHYSLIDIAPFPRRSQPVTEMVSPLKPLEALAMEKAVVVSSLRALTEMIQHDVTGLVYEKDNNQALAAVLHRLLLDPELRRRLGTVGRTWVETDRTWHATAGTVAQALADLPGALAATSAA